MGVTRSSIALVLLSSLPAFGAEGATGPEVGMFEYMSHEFLRPYFAKGSEVVFAQCPPLLFLCALLLAYLVKGKAWKR